LHVVLNQAIHARACNPSLALQPGSWRPQLRVLGSGRRGRRACGPGGLDCFGAGGSAASGRTRRRRQPGGCGRPFAPQRGHGSSRRRRTAAPAVPGTCTGLRCAGRGRGPCASGETGTKIAAGGGGNGRVEWRGPVGHATSSRAVTQGGVGCLHHHRRPRCADCWAYPHGPATGRGGQALAAAAARAWT
jgi:hypothetical protein